MRKRGFTLIELLIVVAIIAILALIAVPNFLEAQMRAKVVTCRADMRNILVAMQAYRVDWNAYPDDNPRPLPGGVGNTGAGNSWFNDFLPLTYLTTPVAYMTSVPLNPFFDLNRYDRNHFHERGNYAYWGSDRHANLLPIFFHVVSVGPNMESNGAGGKDGPDVIQRRPVFINTLYDPTNGTVSRGDLIMHDRGLVF